MLRRSCAFLSRFSFFSFFSFASTTSFYSGWQQRQFLWARRGLTIYHIFFLSPPPLFLHSFIHSLFNFFLSVLFIFKFIFFFAPGWVRVEEEESNFINGIKRLAFNSKPGTKNLNNGGKLRDLVAEC